MTSCGCCCVLCSAPCAAGTFSAEENAADCTNCTAGSFSDAKATRCITCAAGTTTHIHITSKQHTSIHHITSAYRAHAAAHDVYAVLGKFSAVNGSVSCTQCAAGSRSSAIDASTSCQVCEAKTFSNSTSSYECNQALPRCTQVASAVHVCLCACVSLCDI